MPTKCCSQLLVNVKILTIFCLVSSDWTTRGSSDLLLNRTHQLTRNMICFYSFYFIMQGKLVILRARCFLHQNTSQLQGFKEKTLFQSKFCRKLKSSISKVSKCGVHSVVRLQKKWEGTAIIPTLWFWCEADVDCRRRRWQIHLQPSWWCRRTSREPKTRFPLNFYLMAVLNYSVVLASALFCCLLTKPFEEKPFAFLLNISFEESVNYWVYSRVNNL